jgi:hypothetical protein
MSASTFVFGRLVAHRRLPAFVLTAALFCTAAAAADQPIAPPTDRTPKAAVSIADYRYGDVLWENDRTAHRIYSRTLEAAEPPSTSGIDVWGKGVRWPYMERQLKTGDQHGNHGEGLDFYNVGIFRGAGGLGIWYDNKLWTSRNYSAARILQNGPDVAKFEVDYAPWPVDVVRKVWETRHFALPVGTNFTRLISTIRSDSAEPLIVGIGITKNPTGNGKAEYTVDRTHGRFVWWGPEEPGKGRMGVAVMVDPAMIVDTRDDAGDHLILVKVTPGKPFVYYIGGAWSLGLDFPDAAKWKAYVAAQNPDFDPSH